jgi:nucleotide-binding universal stress UspA family protein
MSETDTHRRARILVMLGSIESDRAALEALSLLAGRTPAEILGMFVEDSELLSLAELPIAREYCLLTHVERHLQAPDLERQFRIQARAAQRSLAEIASRLDSTVSFRTVRGVMTTLLREALAETDLMLFGAGHGTLRIPGEFTRASSGAPSRHALAVVFDGSDAAQRALQTALQIAQERNLPLNVVLTARDTEHISSLADQAIRQAETRGQHLVKLVKLVNPAWQDVLAQVRAQRCAALVIAISAELLQEENLGRLRNELNCPAILVK